MWLKLTAKTSKIEKEKFLYINTDKICLIEEISDGGTHIEFDASEMWAKVKETPEEILQMLNHQTFGICKGVK